MRNFHTVEYDSCDEDSYIVSAIEKEYERQFLESDGFDVDAYVLRDKYDYAYDMGLFSRVGLHCFNLEKIAPVLITLEAMDDTSNSLCNFQTCVCNDSAPSFMVQTELSRLKVPAGPRTTMIGPQRRWKDDAVDDSYKGKMPAWLTEQELAAVSNTGKFYELQESDWQGIEWLHMYAEFAFYSKWFLYGNDVKTFLPLEIKKIIVRTEENREASPDMILNLLHKFQGKWRSDWYTYGVPSDCKENHGWDARTHLPRS